jgi:large subunit ribosomal protein L10
VQAAKGLREFSRANPFLVIKGGVLEGKTLTPAEIAKLADLEPRDVLLAKLAGAMKATMAGAAATFAALPTQMARLLAALEEKKPAEGPTATAGAAPAQGAAAPGAAGDGADAGQPAADAGEPGADAGQPAADAGRAVTRPRG